jgi:LEA14-like dessication related protein
MYKKIIYSLLSLLVISSLACKSISTILTKKPKVTVKEVQIQSFDLKRVKMLVKTEIENPYPLELSLAGIKTAAYVRKNLVAQTRTSKGLKIKAEGKANNNFVVTVKYKDIGRVVKDYLTRDDIICDLKFWFTFKLPEIPGLPRTATIEAKASKKLPSLKKLLKKGYKKLFK